MESLCNFHTKINGISFRQIRIPLGPCSLHRGCLESPRSVPHHHTETSPFAGKGCSVGVDLEASLLRRFPRIHRLRFLHRLRPLGFQINQMPVMNWEICSSVSVSWSAHNHSSQVWILSITETSPLSSHPSEMTCLHSSCCCQCGLNLKDHPHLISSVIS